MDSTTIITLITELSVLLATIIPLIVNNLKSSNGTKCLLRSEMLRIYYHNCRQKTIRQYEYENFVMLYEAYKTLKGNSFIDKIYKEVQTWKVIT